MRATREPARAARPWIRFGRAEHRFAEEHAPDRDAVDAADEVVAVPRFDRVRVAELVQALVGRAHVGVDPGAALPRARRRARAHDGLERAVRADVQSHVRSQRASRRGTCMRSVANTVRGSGDHQRIGWPREYHGNMPRRYAASRRSASDRRRRRAGHRARATLPRPAEIHPAAADPTKRNAEHAAIWIRQLQAAVAPTALSGSSPRSTLLLLRLGRAGDLQQGNPTAAQTSKLARCVAGELKAAGWRLERVLSTTATSFAATLPDHDREARGPPNPHPRRPPADQRPRRSSAQDDPRRCWRPAFARYLFPATPASDANSTLPRLLQPRPRPPRPPHPRPHPRRHRLRCPQDGGEMSRNCRHISEAVHLSRPDGQGRRSRRPPRREGRARETG